MPFIPNTPESLLGRSDSKNPNTTCRGITSGGRPCRRPLGSSPAASPARPNTASRSGAAALRVDDPSDPNLYCWQHKEQAYSSARSSPGPRASSMTTPILEQRGSLDTLIDRLGIVEAEQKRRNTKKKDKREVPERPHHGSGKKKKNKGSAGCCFCFTTEEDEPLSQPRPSRPKPRPLQSAPVTPVSSKPPRFHEKPQQFQTPPSSRRKPLGVTPTSSPFLSPSPSPAAAASASRKKRTVSSQSAGSTTSQTSQYMSLIPPHVSPQTASQLMAELAKPISQQDEPGYIYMFWLTPEASDRSTSSPPPAEAARDLLAPPMPTTPTRPSNRGGKQRRVSDVLESYAAKSSASSNGAGAVGPNKDKSILLKIGRASNVQRRLNEWTRQCGYDLSLIRYYPYISSTAGGGSSGGSPGSSGSAAPRKVPHSHRVERLIHIELAGAGLRVGNNGGDGTGTTATTSCAACGRVHREWFEVEANRKGVMAVDEIVRRWVDWDEGLPGN